MLVGLSIGGCGARHGPEAVAIIEQVDHLLIDAGDADELFRLFAEKLELPVAWPFNDYGGFQSGGVSLGNLNLECFATADSPREPELQGRLVGISFDPAPLGEVMPLLCSSLTDSR